MWIARFLMLLLAAASLGLVIAVAIAEVGR
jgi:hypothetical protein